MKSSEGADEQQAVLTKLLAEAFARKVVQFEACANPFLRIVSGTQDE